MVRKEYFKIACLKMENNTNNKGNEVTFFLKYITRVGVWERLEFLTLRL